MTNIYCDASLSKINNYGSIAIKIKNNLEEEYYKFNNVYLKKELLTSNNLEIIAIFISLALMKQKNYINVNIYNDNQAAINFMKNKNINHQSFYQLIWLKNDAEELKIVDYLTREDYKLNTKKFEIEKLEVKEYNFNMLMSFNKLLLNNDLEELLNDFTTFLININFTKKIIEQKNIKEKLLEIQKKEKIELIYNEEKNRAYIKKAKETSDIKEYFNKYINTSKDFIKYDISDKELEIIRNVLNLKLEKTQKMKAETIENRISDIDKLNLNKKLLLIYITKIYNKNIYNKIFEVNKKLKKMEYRRGIKSIIKLFNENQKFIQ